MRYRQLRILGTGTGAGFLAVFMGGSPLLGGDLLGRVHRQGFARRTGRSAIAGVRLRGCGPARGCEQGEDLADGGFQGAGLGHVPQRSASGQYVGIRIRRSASCQVSGRDAIVRCRPVSP